MDKVQVRVLILDDHEDWRKILFDVVAEAGFDAILAENLKSARNILKSAKPDIVILDMYLRNESNARLPAEGIGLLKDISKSYYENKTGPVVIVFSGSRELSTSDYQEISAYQNQGVVVRFLSKEKYDEEQLRDTLISAMEIKEKKDADSRKTEGREDNIPNYEIEEQPWYVSKFPIAHEVEFDQISDLVNKIDVVIITATDEEIKGVVSKLVPYRHEGEILKAFYGPETYYIGNFGAYSTVVTKCRTGAIGDGSVILATEQAQRIWNPKVVIMVGVGFGKDPDGQKVADVLVASQVISYEQQRVGEKIVYRGPITPANVTLLNRFSNNPNWQFTRPDGEVCTIQVGPILSGEKLIDDPEFKAELFRQYPHAIGGEMEGAGLCAATGRMGVAWILIKAISDWADGKKHDKHQSLAVAAATSLVHFVLSQSTVLSSINKPER